MSDAIVLAVTSDHHCGSTVALAPNEPVPLDDGQEVHPSKAQRWIYQCWRDYWDEVERTAEKEKAIIYNIFNGDIIDGPEHHGTTQVMSRQPGAEKWIAKKCLSDAQALGPDKTFVVRGTESHVGKLGAAEESLAQELGTVRDPDRDTASWWHLRMEVQGLLLSFTHHGRTGFRPWTKPNAHNLLAADIFMQYAMHGERHPDIAFRSHFHQYGESARGAFPVHVVQTPAWQLHTGFTHKVVPESLSDIGGVITVIKDGHYTVRPILHRPSRGSIWRAA